MAADLLLTGGRIHTVDARRTTAEAVAVESGRIAAVGSAAALAELAGPATRIVELSGRMVLPGFQDAHLHPPSSGLAELQCPLDEATTREECLETVARYAAEYPDREWILGEGWSMDSFEGGTPLKDDRRGATMVPLDLSAVSHPAVPLEGTEGAPGDLIYLSSGTARITTV